MGANADKLARQIGIITAAIGRPFDPSPDVNLAVAADLAAMLDRGGMTDVRNLRYYSAPNLSFFFDVATAHVFPKPAGVVTGAADDPTNGQLWFYEGRFTYFAIYCRIDASGIPIFLAQTQDKTSEWQEFVHGIIFLASVSVSVAFPALASSLGQAIMGVQLAAQYPALAAGLGQVCVSTALNGGDVQSAVTGALTAGVGNGVGGFVASASDSTIIGAVAGSATRAAISGGNIESAALQSLAASGLQSVAPLLTPKDDTMQLADSWAGGDDTDVTPWVDDTSGALPGFNPSDFQLDTSQGYHDPAWSVDGSAEGASVPLPSANAPPVGPNGVVASANGTSLTALAVAALHTISSWNSAGQPTIRTSNATVTANKNGTLTNTATGQVSQMPPGTPYLTSDGSLVTNNGNGSYTVVGSNGSVAQGAYTGTSIFGSGLTIPGLGTVSPVLLLGGAGLALLLLMGGSRR